MEKKLFYKELKKYNALNAFVSTINRIDKIQPGKWNRVNRLINGLNHSSDILAVSFRWRDTKQGVEYWEEIFYRLKQKKLGEKK